MSYCLALRPSGCLGGRLFSRLNSSGSLRTAIQSKPVSQKHDAVAGDGVTFEALGMQPAIAAALYAAFPDVKSPTETQKKFIPAVLNGRDMLLKDDTGTGKSFGLIMALLSKPRLLPSPRHGQTPEKPFITSLFIVPHRDLAYQMLHWIQRMCLSAERPLSLPSIARVLVRGASTSPIAQASALRSEPPHILIGTPQALLEVYSGDPSALQLGSLSTVVVDEADYLIESVPNKDSKGAMDKERKKLDRHPSPTKQLLDVIFAARLQAKHDGDERKEGDSPRSRGVTRHGPQASSPQLIMSSATLRNHLKLYLNHSGWLKGSNYKKVNGVPHGADSRSAVRQSTSHRGSSVHHYALVVSRDGEIRNIDGARKFPSLPQSPIVEEALTPSGFFSSPENSDLPPPLSEDLREKFSRTPCPFNLNALETIATAFAFDVPAIALLVLPASSPVQRAVYEMRELGINAHSLDLLADDRGRAYLLRGKAESRQENPTLLVSTLASTRGIDLPELTHVFIYGVPESRMIDAYLHIAGRVGRFGRGGKVISVLEKLETNAGEEENTRTVPQDESRRMGKIYKALDITPMQFEQFD